MDKAKRMIELAKKSREIMTKITKHTLLLQKVNEELETLKLTTDFETYKQNVKRKLNKHQTDMYKQPHQTGKDKKAHRALLHKDKQAERDVLMWKFSVALKLLQQYSLNMTDPKAALLSQKEAANISDITNTIYRFFAVAFSKSPRKKELETLMFENVAALIEVIDITLQIPPEKAEQFSTEALELAKRLTNQFIAEKQNGI